MQLVEDFKKAHKWLSMRFSALGAAAMTAWLATPEDSQKAIVAWVADRIGIHDPVAAAALVAFIAVMVGRLKKQGGA